MKYYPFKGIFRDKSFHKDLMDGVHWQKEATVIFPENEGACRELCNDWYLAEKKDYKLFASKYLMNGELKKKEAAMDNLKA